MLDLPSMLHTAFQFFTFCSSRTSFLRPFGTERLGRPSIPLNSDAVARQEFSAKYLQPLDLKPDWTFSERDVLKQVLNEKFRHGTEIDWEQVRVCCQLIDLTFVRSAESCEIEYIHGIPEKREWTSEEDLKLSSLVLETGGTDWIKIGELLGRTACECFSRCYLKLDPSLVPAEFTAEDDARLSILVEEYGESSSNWSNIATAMGTGHTASQCTTRWTKTLKPGIQSGRWNQALDKKLLAAVAVYGPGKWKQIAQHVPGKTDRKCRERYADNLPKQLKPNTEWTSDEDRLLVSLCGEFDKWSQISPNLAGRTDHQCRLRFKKIAQPELREKFEKKNSPKKRF